MSAADMDEEMHEMADVADALGALASVAAASRQELRGGSPSRPTQGPGAQENLAPGQSRQRSIQRPEMQKWVQCNRCQKWRKVPYNLKDDELPEDWECKHNVWDVRNASCMVPQALSNEEIDQILALQQQEQLELQQQQHEAQYEEPPFEEAEPEYYDGDGGEDDYGDGDDDLGDGADDDLEGGKRMRAKFGNRPKIRRAGSDVLPAGIPSPGRRGGRGGRVAGTRGRGLTPRGGRGGRGGRGASRGGRGGRATAGGFARSRSGGRGYGRGIGGVSDAANALMHMGVMGEGDMYDMEMNAMGMMGPPEHVLLQRPDFPYPRDTLRPGRVVWAKVEGHDWWPAKIVRRRAVPREVGPPPGGHASVLLYIPVVFFTNKGIPGEVEERLDTAQGIVAASMRALGMGEEEEDEEAEYAWLPLDCLKPFKVGDISGNGCESGPIIDPNLRTSIAHAEAAMRQAEQPANAASLLAPDANAGGGGLVPKTEAGLEGDLMADGSRASLPEEDFLSDSDGGWGAPAHFQAAVARGFRGGRGGGGRGGRRGRGRGRGGRRGRGRRGIAPRQSDDEDDYLDELPLEPLAVNPADAFAAGAAGVAPAQQKTQVEAIYGWRFPLSEQEKAQERDRQRQLELERHRILDRLRKSAAAAGSSPNADAIADAVAAANVVAAAAAAANKAAAAASAAGGGAAAGEHPAADHMATDEADAAAALLGFGDEADPAAAAAAAASGALDGADGGAGLLGADREPEYLVKWAHRSHIHNEWVKESALMAMARRKLLNFKKRHGDRPCNAVDEAWTRPERFVSRRPSPSGPGWEVLIKWCGLGYEQATWEAEGNKLLLQPEYVALHTAMWARCKRGLHKVSRAAAEAAEEALVAASPDGRGPADLAEQPAYVSGARLHPHQLQAVSWLRRMWAAGKHAVVADDMGLGKTAAVITFLNSLIHDFKVTGPLLVVAPQAMLDFWEGDWAFWAGGVTADSTATAGGTGSGAGGGSSREAEALASTVAAAAGGGPVNVVVYTGSAAARTLLHEQELWLSPSSLDRKGTMGRGRENCPNKVPKVDVVIAGYEHVQSDLAALKTVPWEAVVVDMRQRGRGITGRNTGALAELGGRHRVLLMGSNPAAAPLEEVVGFAQFIRPDVQAYDPEDYLASEGAAEAARTRLGEALEARCCRQLGRELVRHVTARREVQIPVDLSELQSECYRTVLARHFEVLADPRPPRHSGHRAALMKHICNELRKVCHHPYLLEEFRTEAAEDALQPASGGSHAAAAAAPESADAAADDGGHQLSRASLTGRSSGVIAALPSAAASGAAASAAAPAEALLAASGKLAVLDKLLQELRRRRRSVLVLSQSAKALDILEAYSQRTFGPAAAVRIDSATPSAVRHANITAFNAAAAAAAAATVSPSTSAGGAAPPSSSTPAGAHTDAVASAAATPFIVLSTSRTLGLGTDLPSVRAVVIFDGDWHPRLDMQALRRAYRLGEPGQLPVYRLYARGTVEERLLQLVDRRRGLETIFQHAGAAAAARAAPPPPGGGGAAGAAGAAAAAAGAGLKALEEVLKWGTAALFRPGTADGGAAADAGVAEASTGAGLARRQERGTYSEEQVRELLDLGHAACCSASGAGGAADAAAAAADAAEADAGVAAALAAGGDGGDAGGVPLGPGLELVTVRTWADVDKRLEDDLPAASDEADEDLPDDMEDDPHSADGAAAAALALYGGADGAYGTGLLSLGRSDSGTGGSSGANALYWSSLLRERYEVMRKEEDPGHDEGHHVATGGRRSSVMDMDSRDDGDDLGDLGHDDDEADDETYRPGRGPSSMSYGMQDSYDDGAGGPRPGGRGRGRGRGRGGLLSGGRGGRGRGGRGRRADHELDDGGGYGPGGGSGGVGYMEDRPFKRRRRGIGGVADEGAGGGGGDAAAQARVREVLLREVSRMEAVKKAISDAASPEYAVAQRSYTRLKEVAAELDLHAEAAAAISDMACQVADILVMMRQEDEAPSDFQDYTLVAIIAVAAHLVKVALGEDYGLRRLGDRYGHDLAALDQVFWHILTRLSYYRELHVRSSQLAADGGLSPGEAAALLAATGGGAAATAALGGERGGGGRGADAVGAGSGRQGESSGGGGAGAGGVAGGGGAGGSQTQVVSEADSFTTRLQAILQSDVSTAVYAQVSAENIPLGPLATLMPLLQMAGVLNDPNMKSVLKSTRDCQENLVVLDRSHGIKVQQIQKEYQDYMEKVRSKAQGAIDTANREYQAAKAQLTQRMNLYIEYLQSQLPVQRLTEMAAQIQRTAQQVSQQQQSTASAAVTAAAAAAVAAEKATPGSAAAAGGGAAAAAALVGHLDTATALAAIAAAMQGMTAGGGGGGAAAMASLMGLGPLGSLDMSSGGSANTGAAAAAATTAAAAATSAATANPAVAAAAPTAAAADVTMTDAAGSAAAHAPQQGAAPVTTAQLQSHPLPPQQQQQQQAPTQAAVQSHAGASAPQSPRAHHVPAPPQAHHHQHHHHHHHQPQPQAQQHQQPQAAQALLDPRTAAALAAVATAPQSDHLLAALAALAANRISLDQLPEHVRNQLSALSGGRPLQAYLEQLAAASSGGGGQTNSMSAVAAAVAAAAAAAASSGGAYRAAASGGGIAAAAAAPSANGPLQHSGAVAAGSSKAPSPAATAAATPAASLQAVVAGLPAGATLLQQQPAARRSLSGGSASRPPLPGGSAVPHASGGAQSQSISLSTSSVTAVAKAHPHLQQPHPHTHSPSAQQYSTALANEQPQVVTQTAVASAPTGAAAPAVAAAPYGVHQPAGVVASTTSSYQQLLVQQHHAMQRALGPPPPGMPNVPRAASATAASHAPAATQAPSLAGHLAAEGDASAAGAPDNGAGAALAAGTWQRAGVVGPRTDSASPPSANDAARPRAGSAGGAEGHAARSVSPVRRADVIAPAPAAAAAAAATVVTAAQAHQLLAAAAQQYHATLASSGQPHGLHSAAAAPHDAGQQQRPHQQPQPVASAGGAAGGASAPASPSAAHYAHTTQQQGAVPYGAVVAAPSGPGPLSAEAASGYTHGILPQQLQQSLPRRPSHGVAGSASPELAPAQAQLLAASSTPGAIDALTRTAHPGSALPADAGQHPGRQLDVSEPPQQYTSGGAGAAQELFSPMPAAASHSQAETGTSALDGQSYTAAQDGAAPLVGALPAPPPPPPQQQQPQLAHQGAQPDTQPRLLPTAAAAAPATQAATGAIMDATAAVANLQAAYEQAAAAAATAAAAVAAQHAQSRAASPVAAEQQQLGAAEASTQQQQPVASYPAAAVAPEPQIGTGLGASGLVGPEPMVGTDGHASPGEQQAAGAVGQPGAVASPPLSAGAGVEPGPPTAAELAAQQAAAGYQQHPQQEHAAVAPANIPPSSVAQHSEQQIAPGAGHSQLDLQQQFQQYQQYEPQYGVQQAAAAAQQVQAGAAMLGPAQQEQQQPQEQPQQQPGQAAAVAAAAKPPADAAAAAAQSQQHLQQLQYQQQYAAQLAAMAMQQRAPYGYDQAAYAAVAAAAAAAAGQGYGAAAGYNSQMAAQMAAIAAYGGQAAAAAASYPAAYATGSDPAALVAAYQWQQQAAQAQAQAQQAAAAVATQGQAAAGMEALYAQHAAAAMYQQQLQQQQLQGQGQAGQGTGDAGQAQGAAGLPSGAVMHAT